MKVFRFTNADNDHLWSNTENWLERELPGEDDKAVVGQECHIDIEVNIAAIIWRGGCFLKILEGGSIAPVTELYEK